MLFPKKVKFRKWHSGRKNPKRIAASVETRGTTLSYGSFGLKAQGAGRIKSNQIEAARRAMSRQLGKTGRLWIRIFPDRPITQKAAEVPMGKGKGAPVGFCAEIKSGRMLFEVDGVTPEVARESLRKAGTKLPVKVKVVARGQ
jgi:large subunit ribosomal protein L16